MQAIHGHTNSFALRDNGVEICQNWKCSSDLLTWGKNERNQVQDPRATITPMFLQKHPSLHCDFPSQNRSKELRDIKKK